MKKFLIAITFLVLALMAFDYLYYYAGVLYLPSYGEPAYFSKAEGEALRIDRGQGFEPLEIRGVNMGLGKPGGYATEQTITKEEYLRWFRQIQDLGANVLRVYTLAHPDFYEAFYEYNVDNPNPLYLIHGVWVDDYLINASYSALDKSFYEPFFDSCRAVVDSVHGRHKDNVDGLIFPRHYRWDISQWVYSYILGVEWEKNLVSYTDRSLTQRSQFEGTYFRTENASNFEIFLAHAGEEVASYETEKYGTQRMIAFSNWSTTDPLEHTKLVSEYFEKVASVDVEHIQCTEAFAPGQFASYHIYPYYPDYYALLPSHEFNTYLQYLRDINEHHTMPVVISEFGVPSSRGKAAYEESLGRNQGFMSEQDQGNALVSMYKDIMAAGSAGGIVFTWQDEWFKRTWNTMASVNLDTTPYWSDYQTNEQYFGLLSFDPGTERSVCYVDGDKEEWTEAHLVTEQNGARLSMQYDEKFLYFLVEKENMELGRDWLYLPIDVTPKSGSTQVPAFDISMSDPADFIIELIGESNSRVWVHEYYDTLDAVFYEVVSSRNIFSKTFPSPDSTKFIPIRMVLRNTLYYELPTLGAMGSPSDKKLTPQQFDSRNPLHYNILENYETGRLTYGNANPSSPGFNSLADFCAGDGFVEIKLPWQLLNFADPSGMKIHDDYYEVYGVEYLTIDHINVGAGDGSETILMEPFPLKKMGKSPEYHERLKQSYYILQDYWKNN